MVLWELSYSGIILSKLFCKDYILISYCQSYALRTALKIMLWRACCEYYAVQWAVSVNCTGSNSFVQQSAFNYSDQAPLSVPRQQKTPLGIKWLKWTMDNMVGRVNPWVIHKMPIECLAEYLYSTHPLVKAAASRDICWEHSATLQ